MQSFLLNYGSLAVFLVTVVVGGISIGYLSAPGTWYTSLKKPSFNPPNWIFGPVWTVLYLFIAIAGWRIWQIDPASLAMKAWFAQMILNFAWSPTFFVAHRMRSALWLIAFLFLSVALFICASWPMDRFSSLLFLPYVIWVGLDLHLH